MPWYKFSYIYACLIILTSACSGQPLATQSTIQPTGKVVSALDYKTWAIYQDQKDHYWFGSNGNGVFHYDGKKLTQYTQNDGLVDNQIRNIKGDHLGNVFIETPSGISKYDGHVFTTLQLVRPKTNEWKLAPNDLWFNCNANGLYRYDGEKLFELSIPKQHQKEILEKELKQAPSKNNWNNPYAVFGVDKDKAGNVWVGTQSAGAFRFDGTSFLWIVEKELSTLPDGRVPGVRSMLEDKDGNMWLSNFISKYQINGEGTTATYEKLASIDPNNELVQDQLPYFNSGLSDADGNLWMTTYGDGVWKYDGEQLLNLPVKNGVTDALIISIYQDRQGVLWLGTDNLGVFRYNGERFEQFDPVKLETINKG